MLTEDINTFQNNEKDYEFYKKQKHRLSLPLESTIVRLNNNDKIQTSNYTYDIEMI